VTGTARALAASSLFAALSEAILADVGRLMRPVEFEVAGIVLRQGHPGDHLILVGSGRLEAWLSTPAGREASAVRDRPG
jgi:CRP-like cAMP-binding protein